MSKQSHPGINQWLLHAAAGFVVIVMAGVSATWVFAFGLWVLLIGDRESNLFWLAPLLGVTAASGAFALFRRLSQTGMWRALVLTLAGTFVCVVAGWGLIIFIDEGF